MIFGTTPLQPYSNALVVTPHIEVSIEQSVYGSFTSSLGISTFLGNYRSASLGNNHYATSPNYLYRYTITSDNNISYLGGITLADATVSGAGDLLEGNSAIHAYLPSVDRSDIYQKNITGLTSISAASLIYSGSSTIAYISAGSTKNIFFVEEIGATYVNDNFYYSVNAIKEAYHNGTTWQSRLISIRPQTITDMVVLQSNNQLELVTVERNINDVRIQKLTSLIIDNGVIREERDLGTVSESIFSALSSVAGSTIKTFALGTVDSGNAGTYTLSSKALIFSKQNGSWDLGKLIPTENSTLRYGLWDYLDKKFFVSAVLDLNDNLVTKTFYLNYGMTTTSVTNYLESFTLNNYNGNITLGNYVN